MNIENADAERVADQVYRSLIVPVYRNETGIPALVAAVSELAEKLGPRFEAVFVIDGSPDRSGELLAEALPNLKFPAKIAFHSRNFGAFTAVRTGLELASGKHITGMSADLQEPPSLILELFDALARDEADVVFGTRVARADSKSTVISSNLFWWIYRRFVQPQMPRGGVDVFACTTQVRDAVLSITEPNSSLIAQLFWVGFRRSFVPYHRQRRKDGRSSWSISRRLRYMVDSIVSFTDSPILLILWIGILGSLLSFTFGVFTAIFYLFGYIDVPGYTSIVVLILFIGSIMLVSQGVIGSYLWRAFENTKNRPLRIISHIAEGPGARRPATRGDQESDAANHAG